MTKTKEESIDLLKISTDPHLSKLDAAMIIIAVAL